MKSPNPVTIYDLECSARDAKNGECEYEGVKVYWDDAADQFNYYIDDDMVTKRSAIDTLAYRIYSKY